ncbi:MAG: DUF4321 domain-containing protein [Candidatus Cellulosilyticum pullistercoris]|uniref:DUF4321 domain-containing protein n=1 Tax=Candidatus Cellulosilyticum pullistercoris TaxID=2838521 RepID=A0A9E2KAM9_9FIRM|nr:DUF4321 domain-containing protein [Candidatus Cellulosilyticum pullistercoris]
MANGTSKFGNVWILLLCILSGLTVGYFIGNLCDHISYLEWMNYTGTFGLDQPIQVNLGVLWFSIQVKFNITLAAVIGMLLGIALYKKI